MSHLAHKMMEETSIASVLENLLDTKNSEHTHNEFFLGWLTKKNLPLQLQLRIKQEVCHALSKAQLNALLSGPAGTSTLSAGLPNNNFLCIYRAIFLK